MFCRNRSSSVPPFLDKSNRQQLLNLLLSGFAWNDPRRVCRILENKCVHSWRSRLECQPPDKKWSTAFNISCILFFFFSEVHPLWKPLAQLGSAPASSWLYGDPANNLPVEFWKKINQGKYFYKKEHLLKSTFGWIVASLRPVSKLLKREYQALSFQQFLIWIIRWWPKKCSVEKRLPNLNTAVTSSSSRSVSRFGLLVMFVQTRTFVRCYFYATITQVSFICQMKQLWFMQKIHCDLLLFTRVTCFVAGWRKKAKLVVSDINFWFSMNSGMTRTLGRKEGRLACLCTIWCNCAQLLHPRWCSGNQC